MPTNKEENEVTTNNENNDVKQSGVAAVNVYDSVQLLLEAEFELLGQKLIAAYKKEENGYRILLAPTNYEKNDGVTIGEMVKQVNAMLGKIDKDNPVIKEEELKDQIEKADSNRASGLKFDKIRFILQTAYLYIVKEGEKSSVEYAFNMRIDSSEVFPKDFIVKVDGVSIAVWNTKRKKVVDSMSLFDPKTFIEG